MEKKTEDVSSPFCLEVSYLEEDIYLQTEVFANLLPVVIVKLNPYIDQWRCVIHYHYFPNLIQGLGTSEGPVLKYRLFPSRF